MGIEILVGFIRLLVRIKVFFFKVLSNIVVVCVCLEEFMCFYDFKVLGFRRLFIVLIIVCIYLKIIISFDCF